MPPESTATATPPAAENIDPIQALQSGGIEVMIDFGSKLLIALLIVLIGFWITKRVIRLIKKLMHSRNVDKTLRPFIGSSVNFLLRAMVLIIAVSTMGVEMTSIIAVLGSIGLAIGLALQGSLANFAGGVVVLTLKPFKVGDFIEAQGAMGTVEEISIISTTITTLDFKTVYIPNGPLAGGTITNMTKREERRVDLTFGISYTDDIDKARSIIYELAMNYEYVVQEPAPPFIKVLNLGDSSVDFTVRLWAHKDHYWDVYFYMMEHVKKEFDRQGVTIPFPQRDVHLFPTGQNNG